MIVKIGRKKYRLTKLARVVAYLIQLIALLGVLAGLYACAFLFMLIPTM